ncbi:hypothetical protein AA23498_0102 [Acetobacter nitrogenifigens DSM 23921 = NBRC 105050]|uniref:Uncharacterized protein n=1 Tax=Acetobacter nitrogenifigens DSM 23921 = NBRC 105050 TaxID=1120919 RepID=A0A511X8W7_9PROT|nr:hypothetical protein AA23498_0102 [Acetobacter nitrogenifigens DSM 23921 = NBRC 105050]GEN59383.1 hypothetical protein ANI02nite_12670 [Acetobacter nitrogenifigens DSM 23921 = NBRC 105050]
MPFTHKEVVILTTTKGTKLEYRELNPGEILDLLLACGDGAQNQAYISVAQTWCSIRAIDGIPVPFPRNHATIRDLANQIGSEGLDALHNHIDSLGSTCDSKIKDEIKN